MSTLVPIYTDLGWMRFQELARIAGEELVPFCPLARTAVGPTPLLRCVDVPLDDCRSRQAWAAHCAQKEILVEREGIARALATSDAVVK